MLLWLSIRWAHTGISINKPTCQDGIFVAFVMPILQLLISQLQQFVMLCTTDAMSATMWATQ